MMKKTLAKYARRARICINPAPMPGESFWAEDDYNISTPAGRLEFFENMMPWNLKEEYRHNIARNGKAAR